MKNFKKFNYTKRQCYLYILGICSMPFGVVLTINSHFGSGGIDAFNFIMAEKLHIKTSAAIYITAFTVVLFTALIRKGKPRFTTFISSFLLGLSTDVWKRLLINIEGTTVVVSIVLTVIGLVLISFAVAAYMQSGFPTSPTDDLIVAFYEKGISIRTAKILFDLFFVLLAYVLGGEIGVGTVLCTFLLGPVISVFYQLLGQKNEKKAQVR